MSTGARFLLGFFFYLFVVSFLVSIDRILIFFGVHRETATYLHQLFLIGLVFCYAIIIFWYLFINKAWRRISMSLKVLFVSVFFLIFSVIFLPMLNFLGFEEMRHVVHLMVLMNAVLIPIAALVAISLKLKN